MENPTKDDMRKMELQYWLLKLKTQPRIVVIRLVKGQKYMRFFRINIMVMHIFDANRMKCLFYQIIRGSEYKLVEQLTEDTPSITQLAIHSPSAINDPSYVEDFLLTHRTFICSTKVMQHLLDLMLQKRSMDKVTRVLLLWVG